MIAAIVLAAGQSLRMGRPKMVLPWGNTTVIGHVVSTLLEGGVDNVVVVTGGARAEVETALSGLSVCLVFNPSYAETEMLDSFKAGLLALGPAVDATLVALGDQPQMQVQVVQEVIDTYQQGGFPVVVPSYQNKRGHPWLLERTLWAGVIGLSHPASMRDFLKVHAGDIHYLLVDTPTVLQDLDTPQDYERYQLKGDE